MWGSLAVHGYSVISLLFICHCSSVWVLTRPPLCSSYPNEYALFFIFPQLWKICSDSLQVIFRNSCSTCSYSFRVSMGRDELRIFLLGHLELPPHLQFSHIFSLMFAKIIIMNIKLLATCSLQLVKSLGTKRLLTKSQLECRALALSL